MERKVIARIRTDFDEKFGIPRQSGLAPSLTGRIIFEPEYRSRDALRELDGFGWLWLIWGFSKVPEREEWEPMVRPPRLGGNRRVGVFASRSPFRPNRLGLSSVKLEKIVDNTPQGPVLIVSGVDMLDGTPIYDIKPYHPQADCHPDAAGGFIESYKDYRLQVQFPEELLRRIPAEKREALCQVLAEDPRPGYQKDASRLYGLHFAGYNIRFRVEEGILKVVDVEENL